MFTLLHYLPHVIIPGLILLALDVLFGDDGRKRHAHPQRVRQQHYVWCEDDVRRH